MYNLKYESLTFRGCKRTQLFLDGAIMFGGQEWKSRDGPKEEERDVKLPSRRSGGERHETVTEDARNASGLIWWCFKESGDEAREGKRHEVPSGFVELGHVLGRIWIGGRWQAIWDGHELKIIKTRGEERRVRPEQAHVWTRCWRRWCESLHVGGGA